eukprot:6109665-Prorocentrum_lima.AAC.1
MAPLGCKALRAPSIYQRIDFGHGYHLVIDDVWDLKAIIKEGLFKLNGNTPPIPVSTPLLKQPVRT